MKCILAVFLTLLTCGVAEANQAQMGGAGSVLNILLLVLVAYFLVRMFRRRMGDDDRPGMGPQDRNDAPGGEQRSMDRHEAARQMWKVLSSEPETQQSNQPATPTGAPAYSAFDEAEFIEGAKLFFSRVQEARDSRELDSLKPFLADDVYSQLTAEAAGSAESARTEIMLLNAKVMEVDEVGDRTKVSVFYDADMRKGVSGERTAHVRAVWEFSRATGGADAMWTLEAINKVDQ